MSLRMQFQSQLRPIKKLKVPAPLPQPTGLVPIAWQTQVENATVLKAIQGTNYSLSGYGQPGPAFPSVQSAYQPQPGPRAYGGFNYRPRPGQAHPPKGLAGRKLQR